jgi:hypothetical protein
VNPKAPVAHEAPVHGSFTVGVQLGPGLRGGVGSAAPERGVAEVTLLAVAGYRCSERPAAVRPAQTFAAHL